MRMVVIGCGRIGSVLANHFSEAGHDVVVLDRSQDAFRRLSENFSGERRVGNGLVEEYVHPILEKETDVLFVMTEKDNVNLMIGQWAKQKFGIKRVIAEVHDAILAGLYKEMGLETVCPAELVLRNLLEVFQEE